MDEVLYTLWRMTKKLFEIFLVIFKKLYKYFRFRDLLIFFKELVGRVLPSLLMEYTNLLRYGIKLHEQHTYKAYWKLKI